MIAEKTVRAIETSKVKRILEPIRENPGEWGRSGGSIFKVYKDGGKLVLLGSQEKAMVREARALLAGRVGANDVETAKTMLAHLSDSEQKAFAGGTASYSLVAIYSKDGKIMGAANSVSWKELNIVMDVLVAVDAKFERKGIGRLLNSENLLIGFQEMPDPRNVKYIFGEMEPNEYTVARIASWHGKKNSFALDLPYPLPPLEEGRVVSSLIPAFFAVKGVQPENGIKAKEARDILTNIQKWFYGTTQYIDAAFEKFRDRAKDGRMQMKDIGTKASQHDIIILAEAYQDYFNILWPQKK